MTQPVGHGVVVRPATDADMPAIAAIYGEAVANGTATWDLAPPGVDEMRARWRAIVGEDYPYLVATRDERLVGYAYAGAWRPRPGYRFTVENTVYVAPDAQRHGVGRQLLSALIGTCADRGWRQMVAVIGGVENLASLRLHAAQGFVEVGRLPGIGRKFGRWLDCVLMQRMLGDGASTPPPGN